MARNKNRRGRGKSRGQSRDDAKWRSDVVEKIDMHNERLEKYYKAQNILSDEEWDSFLSILRDPLPTTFRVTGSRQTARLLNDTIRDTHVPHLAGVEFEGEAVSPPTQIPWYPDGLAWHFNVSKKVLRKSPEFKKFHSFLVFETEVGNISRQEAVSMLPPLFLEVEPHHRVMDMCAAPGSKTAQLLEALHAHDTVTASSIPSGLLIANDSDNRRTHLLIHQSARLPSPAFMVTNHDASIYPAIKIPAEQTVFPSNTKARVVAKRQHQLLFDRILCDVPCSGDGTIRKNPGIWKNWSPMDGNGLHGLQLRILQRAMRMLKKGGRIVYSTCSLNPVENEAVIAAALKSIPGFELLEVSSHLPGLIHRPGLTCWRPTVPTPDRSICTDYATFDDYIQTIPEANREDSKLKETHWPPPQRDVDALNLSRCLRIYPHLQDTGGFFIAVLQKVPDVIFASEVIRSSSDGKRLAQSVDDLETSDVKKIKLSEDEILVVNDGVPATEEENPLTSESPTVPTSDLPSDTLEASTSVGKGKVATKQSRGPDASFKENPFTFVSPDDLVISACVSRLHLNNDFPIANILVRNPEGDPVRSLYMTNDIVKHIVENNDYTRMRLVTCGTKVMSKQEGAAAKREGAELQFRVLSEGLPVLLPYIDPESIITADLPTLRILMEGYYPIISGFTDPFRSTIEAKALGNQIVRFTLEPSGTSGSGHDIILPIWKSNASITLMLEKKSKSALSLRVFGEDITTAGKEAVQKKNEEAQKSRQPETEEVEPVDADDAMED